MRNTQTPPKKAVNLGPLVTWFRAAETLQEPSRSHEAGNEGIEASSTSLLQTATYQKTAWK